MTDYNSLKVPELKKLLGDRSLPISGNKADLIARLQEDDKKSTTVSAPAATAAEDEIDWDEDDTKVTTSATAPIAAASTQAPAATPVAIAKEAAAPVPTSDPKTADLPVEAVASAEPEAPKVDFSIGIGQTDAEKEAEKRAARAKRFGIPTQDEDAKKLERAKKFGVEPATVIKGLDDALPERRAKRGREGPEKQGGRNAKRQTPDRRTEAPKAASKPAPAKKLGSVLDDPAEKAKAEARAKKFGTAA